MKHTGARSCTPSWLAWPGGVDVLCLHSLLPRHNRAAVCCTTHCSLALSVESGHTLPGQDEPATGSFGRVAARREEDRGESGAAAAAAQEAEAAKALAAARATAQAELAAAAQDEPMAAALEAQEDGRAADADASAVGGAEAADAGGGGVEAANQLEAGDQQQQEGQRGDVRLDDGQQQDAQQQQAAEQQRAADLISAEKQQEALSTANKVALPSHLNLDSLPHLMVSFGNAGTAPPCPLPLLRLPCMCPAACTNSGYAMPSASITACAITTCTRCAQMHLPRTSAPPLCSLL